MQELFWIVCQIVIASKHEKKTIRLEKIKNDHIHNLETLI